MKRIFFVLLIFFAILFSGCTTNSCGNGKCDSGELCLSCPQDCGRCDVNNNTAADKCGDAICSSAEKQSGSCKVDCPIGKTLCGDGTCDKIEKALGKCPQDCTATAKICGNGFCEETENTNSCPADCQQINRCNNGKCDPEENCSSCNLDCGNCNAVEKCGDGTCNKSEKDSNSCARDCPVPSCGNSVCDSSENSDDCPSDCPKGDVCGDGVCSISENCSNCKKDCEPCNPEAHCGNQTCETGETSSNCPTDCITQSSCGDSVCSADENCSSCQIDCGACSSNPKTQSLTDPILDIDSKNNLVFVATKASKQIDSFSLSSLAITSNIIAQKTPDDVSIQVDSEDQLLMFYSKNNKFFELVSLSTKTTKCSTSFSDIDTLSLDPANNQIIVLTSTGIDSYNYSCSKTSTKTISNVIMSKASNNGEIALVDKTSFTVKVYNTQSMNTTENYNLTAPASGAKMNHKIRINSNWIVIAYETTGTKLNIINRTTQSVSTLDLTGKIADSKLKQPWLVDNYYYVPVSDNGEKIVKINLSTKETQNYNAGNSIGYAIANSNVYLIDSNEKISKATTSGTTTAIAKVYVTIYSHNERTMSDKRKFGEMRDSEAGYKKYRDALIKVANLIHSYGAKYSYQTDYLFLDGMEKYESIILSKDPNPTNGKNIYKYLTEDLGFSVSAHAHECLDATSTTGNCKDKKYNYADLVYRITTVSGIPTDNIIGGTTGEERSISEFTNCIKGNVFTSYSWCSETLTVYGGSSGGHTGGDDYSSGVWRPQELGTNFTTDSPNSKIIYVGTGSHFSSTLNFAAGEKIEPKTYIVDLINKIKNEELDSSKIYTATIVFAEDWMIDYNEYEALEDYLKTIKPFIDSGEIIPATFPETVAAWKTEYNSQPNTLTIDEFTNGTTNPVCGDGTCSSTESTSSCPTDCTTGGGTTGSCGDGVCDTIEKNKGSCPADCSGSGGTTTGTCGDGTCDTIEKNKGSCPADCGSSGTTGSCGDGVCDTIEKNKGLCPQDCG